MDRQQAIHELTMMFLKDRNLSGFTAPQDYARFYIETFREIEKHFDGKGFDTTGLAPNWPS